MAREKNLDSSPFPMPAWDLYVKTLREGADNAVRFRSDRRRVPSLWAKVHEELT